MTLTVDELIEKYKLDRNSKDFGFDLFGAYIEEVIKPGVVAYIERENVTSTRTEPLAESVTSARRSASSESVTSYTSVCVCENCGEGFRSKRAHSKTCSPKCRKALSRKTS